MGDNKPKEVIDQEVDGGSLNKDRASGALDNMEGGSKQKQKNSSSDEDLGPVQQRLKRMESEVDDAKMFAILCSAVLYTISLTATCGYFMGNQEAFTEQNASVVGCQACD